MNFFVISALALVALANISEATWIWGTTAAATSGTTIALSGGTATALGLLGGVILLKGLILGAALLSRRRGKRSAGDDTDAAFAILNNSEPEQCFRRLICDLAAGAIPDNEQLLSLFTEDVSPVSPKFEYTTAAKVGKLVKNAKYCEIRYSCPMNTVEINKLFN